MLLKLATAYLTNLKMEMANIEIIKFASNSYVYGNYKKDIEWFCKQRG